MRGLILALLVSAAAFAEPERLRVEFRQEGIAGVPAADLEEHWPDFDPGRVVVEAGGRPVPCAWEKDTLLFPVGGDGVAYLARSADSRVEAPAVELQGLPSSRVPRSVERFEQDNVFDRLETAKLDLIDGAAGPFFWCEIRDGATLSFRSPGWRKTTKVRMRFQPMRAAGAPHRVGIELNGKELGAASWEGGAPFVAEFETKATDDWSFTFRTQDPPMPRVIASGQVGNGPMLLDWIELDGPQLVDAPRSSWIGDRSVAVDASAFDVVFGEKGRLRGKSIEAEGPVTASTWKALLRPVSVGPAREWPAGGDWIAVAPGSFREALRPLVEYRAGAFVSVEEVLDGAGGGPFHRALRAFVAKRRPRFLLLVGDAERGTERGVPAPMVDALGAGWVATDALYARTDDDELPDVAVGRWPARTPDEAAALLIKVKRLEESKPGEWRRRIHLALGTAGFGAQLDSMLKTGGMKMASDFVPDAFSFCVQSPLELELPFTWPAPDYNRLLTQRVNDGCLIFAYSGHGFEHGLQSLRWGGKRFPILDADLAGNFDVQAGLPLVFLFACSTGSFDEPGSDCLTEAVARAPGGGAAVVGSSGISHPYADMIFAKELMTVVFAKRSPTIGEAVMEAKRRVLSHEDDMRKFLDGMSSGAVGGAEMQKRYRRDGTLAYNLMGDPATRIPLPLKAKMKAPKSGLPGASIEVSGSAEIGDGTAVITLECRRLKMLEKQEPVDPKAAGAEAAMKRNWARANEVVAARVEAAVTGGEFAAAIRVPEKLEPGTYVLKAYARGAKADAVVSRPFTVDEK